MRNNWAAVKKGVFLYPFFILFSVQVFAAEVQLNFNLVWERKASIEALTRHEQAVLALKAQGVELPGRPDLQPKDRSGVWPALHIFNAGILKKVRKFTPPGNKKARLDVLKIKGAKNEWESAQIGIWSSTELKGVSVQLTDLVHKDAKVVIKSNGADIRTYFVYNVLTRKKQSTQVSADMDIDPSQKQTYLPFRYEEEPVALLDLAQIDIRRQTCQAVWLDIFIPKTAAAGIYSGNLIIKQQDDLLSEIPIELTVLPFELDLALDWARGAYISSFVDEKEAMNLLEHGHTQVSWWSTSSNRISIENNKVSADFSPYVDYLKMLDKLGFHGPHTVFLGGDSPKVINQLFMLLNRPVITNGRKVKYRTQYAATDLSPPFEDYLTQTLKQFYSQMSACGHGDIPAAILDEPDHKPKPERLEWYNKVFPMVERNTPELMTFGVFYHKEDEKKLSHHHHVWSTNCPSPEKYEACKKAGRSLFTYNGGLSFYASPGKPRFAVGIIPWVYEAKGTFYWAIWKHTDRAKDDIFSPQTFSGNAITIARAQREGDEGPLSTLVHKGFREAVDDARYIKTFEKLLDYLLRSTKTNYQVKEQKKWLKDVQEVFRNRLYVRGGYVQNHKKWKDWHRPVTSIKIYDSFGARMDLSDLGAFAVQFREDIIRRILSLKKYSLECIN